VGDKKLFSRNAGAFLNLKIGKIMTQTKFRTELEKELSEAVSMLVLESRRKDSEIAALKSQIAGMRPVVYPVISGEPLDTSLGVA